jgi:hypothetical protein
MAQRLTLRDGRTDRGVVESVSAAALRLKNASGSRLVALDAAQTIRKRGDSIVNGTVIGLSIGAAGSLLFGGYSSAICRNEHGINCPRLVPVAWLFPVLTGTALGFLIDADHVGSTQVWKNPSTIAAAPIAGPGAIGVQARVSF